MARQTNHTRVRLLTSASHILQKRASHWSRYERARFIADEWGWVTWLPQSSEFTRLYQPMQHTWLPMRFGQVYLAASVQMVIPVFNGFSLGWDDFSELNSQYGHATLSDGTWLVSWGSTIMLSRAIGSIQSCFADWGGERGQSDNAGHQSSLRKRYNGGGTDHSATSCPINTLSPSASP